MVDDPLDTSDMETASSRLKRTLGEWRDAGAPTDSLVLLLEGFVACKVSEMLKQHVAYTAQETCERQNTSGDAGNHAGRDHGGGASVSASGETHPAELSVMDRLVTVCGACETAACWQGSFMCDSAEMAGIKNLTVRDLHDKPRGEGCTECRAHEPPAALEIQNAMAWLRTIELACDARDDRQSVTYIGQVRAILHGLSRAAQPPASKTVLDWLDGKAQYERDEIRPELRNVRYEQAADLIRELESKQARIDALMFEFCPGEMSAEQRKTWAESQRASTPPGALNVTPILRAHVVDGVVALAEMLSPGLPDGEHELFPVPLNPNGELRPFMQPEPPGAFQWKNGLPYRDGILADYDDLVAFIRTTQPPPARLQYELGFAQQLEGERLRIDYHGRSHTMRLDHWLDAAWQWNGQTGASPPPSDVLATQQVRDWFADHCGELPDAAYHALANIIGDPDVKRAYDGMTSRDPRRVATETSAAPIYAYGLTLTDEDKKSILGGPEE